MSTEVDDLPPGFGTLGKDIEEHERVRVARLPDEPAGELVREREVEPAQMPALKLELTEAMKPLVAEAFGQLTQFLGDLREDIRAQTTLMRALDAPVEAVVESHERASSSFETLRSDMQKIGMETPGAIRELAAVMDTAGLGKAQSRMEKRWERLAEMIEMRLRGIERAHAGEMKKVTDAMIKVLHELERMNARALADAKRRAAGA